MSLAIVSVPVTAACAPAATELTRDPIAWPYPATAIWNHPLGDRARLVPTPIAPPTGRTLAVEEDLLILTPTAPRRSLMEHKAGWNQSFTRCGTQTGKVLATDLPIPAGFKTDPGYTGRTPNHAAAILMPDFTLFETQPLHVCSDGTVVSQYAGAALRGSSILTGGTASDIGKGSHGGSWLTALGGTIRVGEWVPGGAIRHALKIEVDSGRYLSPQLGGYRWPAFRADDGFAGEYGGSIPAARMGSLFVLPPSFPVWELNSEAARILGRSLRRYGAYAVDSTGWDAVQFAVEWGPAGRVKDEFQAKWGFPLVGDARSSSGNQKLFLDDMVRIYGALHVVDDNSPESIGGAGARLAPWAPPLAIVN